MKKGNVKLIKLKKGYFLEINDGITENKLAITKQELEDILYLADKELRVKNRKEK